MYRFLSIPLNEALSVHKNQQHENCEREIQLSVVIQLVNDQQLRENNDRNFYIFFLIFFLLFYFFCHYVKCESRKRRIFSF